MVVSDQSAKKGLSSELVLSYVFGRIYAEEIPQVVLETASLSSEVSIQCLAIGLSEIRRDELRLAVEAFSVDSVGPVVWCVIIHNVEFVGLTFVLS
jgi:hypothetical protein